MNNDLIPLEPGCIALVLAGPDAGKVTGVIACEGKEVNLGIKKGKLIDIYADKAKITPLQPRRGTHKRAGSLAFGRLKPYRVLN